MLPLKAGARDRSREGESLGKWDAEDKEGNHKRQEKKGMKDGIRKSSQRCGEGPGLKQTGNPDCLGRGRRRGKTRQ